MRFFSLAVALTAALGISASVAPAQSFVQSWPRTLLQLQPNSPGMENFWFAGEPGSSRAYLGVELGDIDADRAHALKLDEERGVEVRSVVPGSPAEKAGFRAGDVLLSYNGENILGARQLGRLVSETPAGRKVRIQFWREGKVQTTTAILAAQSYMQKVVRVPGDFDVQMPDMDITTLAIPDPLLVWKTQGIGIEAEPVDGQLAQYFGVKGGVLVRSVEKGSPADKAGVRAGDVLTAVAQRPVTSPRELMSCLRTQRRTGKAMAVSVVREHKEVTLSIAPETPNQE
jgi:serine protease Do